MSDYAKRLLLVGMRAAVPSAEYGDKCAEFMLRDASVFSVLWNMQPDPERTEPSENERLLAELVCRFYNEKIESQSLAFAATHELHAVQKQNIEMQQILDQYAEQLRGA